MPETISATPAQGQADQSAAASQAAASQATSQQADTKQPQFDAKSLLDASSFAMSPEEELTKLRRDYGASSSEARRLKGQVDALSKSLSEQGLKAEFDSKGNFKGFAPDEKYDFSNVPKFKLRPSDLTKEERELLAEDPDKAIEAINARVGEWTQKAFARAKPTIDPQPKEPEPLDAARIGAAVDFAVGRKMANGQPRYENGAQIADVVKQELVNPSLAPDLQRIAATNPGLAAELIADRLQLTIYRMQAKAAQAQNEAAKKNEAAQRTELLSPNGQGQVSIGDGAVDAKAYAARVAQSLLPASARK